MSRPFYQASAADPQGLVRRRRFGFAGGELTGYEDELLRRPADDHESHFLREEIERPRSGPMRDIVATIQPDQDDIVRAPLDRVDLRAGRPGHRQDRGRPAPRGLPALHARRAAGPLRRPRRRAEPRVPALHRAGAAHPRRGRRRADHGRRADRPGAGPRGGPARGRRPQGRRPHGRGAAPGAVGRDRQAGRLDPGDRWPAGGTGCRSSGSSATSTTCAAGPAPTTTSSCCTTPPAGSGWRCCWPRTPGGRRRRPAAARPTPRRAGRRAAPEVRAFCDAVWPARDAAGLVHDLFTDPARLARAARGLLDDEEQALLRWTRRRARCAPRPGPTADAVLVDEVAGLLERTAGYGHVVLDEAQDLSPDAVPRRRPPAGRRARSPCSATSRRRPARGRRRTGRRRSPGSAGRAPSSGRSPAATACPARCSSSRTGCCRSSRPDLPAGDGGPLGARVAARSGRSRRSPDRWPRSSRSSARRPARSGSSAPTPSSPRWSALLTAAGRARDGADRRRRGGGPRRRRPRDPGEGAGVRRRRRGRPGRDRGRRAARAAPALRRPHPGGEHARRPPPRGPPGALVGARDLACHRCPSRCVTPAHGRRGGVGSRRVLC